MKYQTTIEIECAVANFFGIRRNLIVPNTSWGMNIHECDLLILSNSGYATEVEIKISKSDLKKDKEKSHGHQSDLIKRFYFAVPEKISLEFIYEHIPERAGVIHVSQRGRCIIRKQCRYNNKAKKFNTEGRLAMARLGTMRIWSLKNKIIKMKNKEALNKK